MARMLAIGVLLAESLFGAMVPPDAGRELRRDKKGLQIAEQMQRRLLSVPVTEPSDKRLGFRFDLEMRERMRDRMRYIAAHMRPGVGDWAAVPLPPMLAPLHYLIRPFRLMTRYGLS
jgi:hypothetical protein